MFACVVLALLVAVSDPLPRERVVLCGLSSAAATRLQVACDGRPDLVVRAIPANALADVIAADQAAVVMAFGFPVPSLRAAVRAQLLAPLPDSVVVACPDLIDAQRSALPLFIDPLVVARGAAGTAAWIPTWDALDADGVADALVFETPRAGTASAAWFAALSARDGRGASERIERLLRAAGPNLVNDAGAVVQRVAALGPRALALLRRSDARSDARLVFDDLAPAAVEAPAVLIGVSLGFGASGIDPACIAALLDPVLARDLAESEGLLLALPVDATPLDVMPTRRLLAKTLELEDEVLTDLARQRHRGESEGAASASEWFDVVAIVGLVTAISIYLWRRRRIDAASG
ncbi:MAG: hypothetical protein IT459_17870 [Planctomycetes bacterium]|nr:hypothetical protein [Planctomycetota bacterium]